MVPAASSLDSLETYHAIHVQLKVSFFARITQLQQKRKQVRQFTNFLLPAGWFCMQHVVLDAFEGQIQTFYQPGKTLGIARQKIMSWKCK